MVAVVFMEWFITSNLCLERNLKTLTSASIFQNCTGVNLDLIITFNIGDEHSTLSQSFNCPYCELKVECG